MSHFDPNNHKHPPIPVLVWSKNPDLQNKSIEIINAEFDENIYVFTIDHLPTIVENSSIEEIETELEQYNFHLIKVSDNLLELLLLDNSKHKFKIKDNLEEVLENFARKIIDWNHKNRKESC